MENDDELVASSQDERNLAALAHVSALLPYVGAVVPLLIWMTRKERRGFLPFHALQAMMFQISIMIVWIAGFMCYFITFLGSIAALPFVVSESGDIDPIYWGVSFIPFVAIGIILLLGFAFIIYGIVGAVSVYQGKPFRYIVVGRWADRLMRSMQRRKEKQ